MTWNYIILRERINAMNWMTVKANKEIPIHAARHTFLSLIRSVTYSCRWTLVKWALRLVVLHAEKTLLQILQSATGFPPAPVYLGVKYAQTPLRCFREMLHVPPPENVNPVLLLEAAVDLIASFCSCTSCSPKSQLLFTTFQLKREKRTVQFYLNFRLLFIFKFSKYHLGRTATQIFFWLPGISWGGNFLPFDLFKAKVLWI